MADELYDEIMRSFGATETYGGLTTTFNGDFAIAEQLADDRQTAVAATFARAFAEWRSDIKYITNLAMTLNHRCWYWHEKGDETLSSLYATAWATVDGYVYEDGSYTEEEQNYYFQITD